MNNLQEVIQSATGLVVPSSRQAERLGSLAASILSRTKDEARRFPQIHDVILGGSYAKGTWLPGDADIDIFIKISPEVSEDTFERIGLSVGARTTAGYPRGKKYAQHPYTEATVDGVKVNIVPCYDVEPTNWKSAADRSPYHLMIVERLPERQKLQVRLLKKFMKTIGVYGAEIESQGFSGYAAEVLIIRFDDFEGVLRYFADFKPHSAEELFHLSDPVDEERDLARAISQEKLARMVLGSRALLAKPSQQYFTIVRQKRRPPLKRAVVGLVFTHTALSEDTLWGELKRTLKHLETHIESKGFRMARCIAVSDSRQSSAFLFIPELDSLPEVEQRLGPSVDRKSETEEFISKNRGSAKLIWVGDDARVRLLQKRRYTKLTLLMRDTVKEIRRTGASKEMAAGIAKSGQVVTGAALSRLLRSRLWLREGVDEIVSDTIGTGLA